MHIQPFEIIWRITSFVENINNLLYIWNVLNRFITLKVNICDLFF